MRVVGFAQARACCRPRLHPLAWGYPGFVGLIWALVASFVGIRAKDWNLDTGKTLATIVIAFIGAWLISLGRFGNGAAVRHRFLGPAWFSSNLKAVVRLTHDGFF